MVLESKGNCASGAGGWGVGGGGGACMCVWTGIGCPDYYVCACVRE
jgi:hypothetical protein